MTVEFRLPDLGEDTSEGEVVAVLIAEGDLVAKDQIILELETDKALLEVPSPAAGRITKIHTSPGATLKVGDLIISIDESAVAAPDAAAGESAGASASPATGESAGASAPAAAGESVAAAARGEAPSEPADPPVAGEAKPQAPVEAEASALPEPAAKPKPTPPATPEGGDEIEPARVLEMREVGGAGVAAAPSTRRIARELGVDLAQVGGTGPSGRITKEDVKAYAHAKLAGLSGASSSVSPGGERPTPSPDLPDFSRWGPIERKTLSKVRRVTMERLSLSWREIPHVTQIDEADITDLEALRGRHAAQAAERGGKLTVTVFMLKAVVAALKAFPDFNSSLDPGSQELILKNYFHIGIAVDTEHGLLVPVIRDVDKKTLLELSSELLAVSGRARSRKVTVDELRGGTFTITNLGGIGGTSFTPIINHPEVAILGLARTQKRVVLEDGEPKTRLMLPLCLSYDHRVIDGAASARFTRKIASMLEDPALLLLEP